MKVQRLPIGTLKPNPDNPRLIKDDKFKKLVASIRSLPAMLELRPIVVNADMMVLGGNMRLKACQAAGLTEVPVVIADELTTAQQAEFVIKDNVSFGEWEWDTLANEWDTGDLSAWGLDVPSADVEVIVGLTDPDEVPDAPAEPITKPGDLWLLGEHRLLCGDSTKAEDVQRLMAGQKAVLIHADPPYGMGKEKDGIANDNLYADKLDAFQMAWWRVFRPHTEDNGSAYIWGNAEDLWRLWYRGGLKDSERLTMRNEIVWSKGNGLGIGSADHRMFPTVSERCLFFMLGEQGFNNNADNYWEGWEPVRSYLETEMNTCGGSKKWKEALGNNMGGHYFTKSQWCFPTEEAYRKLQAFGQGDAFKREHDDLKREHDDLKREFYATRAYFDNTHDNMTDVWEFPRVTGDDRHGHATPKPVAMMERVMLSSLPKGGLCVEPFGGSGSTLIAAESSRRTCYTMELLPAYCDVIVARWEKFTGQKAVRPLL